MLDDFTAIWFLTKYCVKKASDIDHKWSQLKSVTGNYIRNLLFLVDTCTCKSLFYWYDFNLLVDGIVFHCPLETN